MTKTIRALGLFSGGLDSMLAAAPSARAQGIDVTLVTFVTPFFGAVPPGIGRPPGPAPDGS